MSLSAFRMDELLAFYHCQEFYLARKREQSQEVQGLDSEALLGYMSSIKKWISANIYSEDSSFFGGDDEDSQVVLYSSSLNVFVSVYALRSVMGTVEPIFMSRSLPSTIRDNHLLTACVAIQALKDIGFSQANRVWLTTGEQHLPLVPPSENFDIVTRVCSMMSSGGYQVRTGGKCRFCPIKDSCDVYYNVEHIKSLCATGPATFTL